MCVCTLCTVRVHTYDQCEVFPSFLDYLFSLLLFLSFVCILRMRFSYTILLLLYEFFIWTKNVSVLLSMNIQYIYIALYVDVVVVWEPYLTEYIKFSYTFLSHLLINLPKWN